MAKTQASVPAFHVGDPVRVSMSGRQVRGTILEERGPIGSGGRHLYVVEVPNDPFEPLVIEVAEAQLEMSDPTSDDPIPDKRKAIDYLRQGGLVAILRANLGGRNQPRVWLRNDNLGNVTHSFTDGRRGIGGASVPFWTLHGEKIFLPKVDEVRTLLRGLGLTAKEANDVIASVGTTS
ncbi:MAG TPA: hypothetical protein VH475_11740 [Tepidisphaeraceae bacterium]|jgi:hypothetical protein